MGSAQYATERCSEAKMNWNNTNFLAKFRET